jgi:hypothetical protein
MYKIIKLIKITEHIHVFEDILNFGAKSLSLLANASSFFNI